MRFAMLVAALLTVPFAAACERGGVAGGGDLEESAALADAEREIVVGGYEIEGPDGREIVVPRATADVEDVEEYLGEVRPVVEGTAGDLSGVVDVGARLEDGTLGLDFEVGSVEEARDAAEEGLKDLQEIQPPEDLERVHGVLVGAYEAALPAYDEVIGAFDSGDVDTLSAALAENLPEIERLAAESRSVLQELERAANEAEPEESR